mgnify:FL=1
MKPRAMKKKQPAKAKMMRGGMTKAAQKPKMMRGGMTKKKK